MTNYLIATDGAAKGNGAGTGASSWAFVVYNENQQRLGSKSKAYPKEHRLTNNAMEAQAILEAMKWLAKGERGATIYSDSNYMVQTINTWMHGWAANGWTKKSKGEIQNLEIIKEIYQLQQQLNVRLIHVKGHQTGNSFEATSNREADALCNCACDELEFETEVLK